MYFQSLLNEAFDKGERIGSEVVDELMKSKTIHDFVTSKSFVHAVTMLIDTKDEIKRVIGKQVTSIIDMMDVPTRKEIKRLVSKLGNLEQVFDRVLSQAKKKGPVKRVRKKKIVTKKKIVKKKKAKR